MVDTAFYVNANRKNVGNAGLPTISVGLDSIRAYQFEIHFAFPENVLTDPSIPSNFTLAAKQVTAVGMTVEDIEVNRVNDKVFYPGKASPEELTVTFDNLYDPKVAAQLWEWFRSIYNPMTGEFNETKKTFKANYASVLHLDAQGQPLQETKVYGIYPKSWKTAEFNYSTNEFHTIEVAFRYDFMEQTSQPTTTSE